MVSFSQLGKTQIQVAESVPGVVGVDDPYPLPQ